MRSKPRKRPIRRDSSPMGCGVDVVELDQFRAAVKRGGPAFMRRVFTAQEAAYAKARPRTSMLHLAGRFAAKEAVIKALSQVRPNGLPAMKDVEVRNDRFGRPRIVLHDRRFGRVKIHVSLSHVDTVAVASAIVVRG